jgi:hypothetical protein
MRRAVAWGFVGPPVVALLTFGEVGGRLSPPATDVAMWCFGSAAVLLGLKLLVWIVTAHHAFGPPERLAAFVLLCTIAMGWFGARQWIHQRQFDDLVASQNADLKLTVMELSSEILAFVSTRVREAPPAPRPATWDQDEAAAAQYEIATERAFERRFGKQVRATHDILGLLGIADKDLDVFYPRPADAFQMRVVAVKLARLADRVGPR